MTIKEAYALGVQCAVKQAGLLDLLRNSGKNVRRGIEGLKYHWNEAKNVQGQLRAGVEEAETKLKELVRKDPNAPKIFKWLVG